MASLFTLPNDFANLRELAKIFAIFYISAVQRKALRRFVRIFIKWDEISLFGGNTHGHQVSRERRTRCCCSPLKGGLTNEKLCKNPNGQFYFFSYLLPRLKMELDLVTRTSLRLYRRACAGSLNGLFRIVHFKFANLSPRWEMLLRLWGLGGGGSEKKCLFMGAWRSGVSCETGGLLTR